MEIEFKNDTKLKFDDISSEEYRTYEYRGSEDKTIKITVEKPLKLNVAASGGHRIFDGSGLSHYFPKGWIHLSWKAKKGCPNFVK